MQRHERIRAAITRVLNDWISIQELDEDRRLKLTEKLVEEISPIANSIGIYNATHGELDDPDCCGTFDTMTEDDEIICNECGRKLSDCI